MAQQIRRRRISVYAMPVSVDERRTMNEHDRDYQGPRVNWRMCPPPDGPPLTPEQIATCCRGVVRALEAGAWQVAVGCVLRVRGGQVLRATQDQLAPLQDGPRLQTPIAEIVARTVEVWLQQSSVEAACTAIRRRKNDELFAGEPLLPSSLIEELRLSNEIERAVKCGGAKTLADVTAKLELWAQHPALTPKRLSHEWCELSRMLLNAGLLGPLALKRLEKQGRNSKAKKA